MCMPQMFQHTCLHLLYAIGCIDFHKLGPKKSQCCKAQLSLPVFALFSCSRIHDLIKLIHHNVCVCVFMFIPSPIRVGTLLMEVPGTPIWASFFHFELKPTGRNSADPTQHKFQHHIVQARRNPSLNIPKKRLNQLNNKRPQFRRKVRPEIILRTF